MERKRVPTDLDIQPDAESITATLATRLTAPPIDGRVLRGRPDLADDLRGQDEALAEMSPDALSSILESVERNLCERFGISAWTDVADGYPAQGSTVLAWHRHEGYLVLEYDRRQDGECWFTHDCETVDPDEIAAWRALPPAPR